MKGEEECLWRNVQGVISDRVREDKKEDARAMTTKNLKKNRSNGEGEEFGRCNGVSM